MKVVGVSKQIVLIRNTERQKKPNLYRVIDIGCRYDKNALKKFNHSSSTLLL